MNTVGTARIISASDKGLEVCAAAARISTTEGEAMALFAARAGDERDRSLVKKVLASGHESLIEHHTFTIAFSNVSVLAEQFLIESRLASFTVKSRRYVNFADAGFYVPPSLLGALRDQYVDAMRARFDDYAFLTERGVPREDARFVLPYCFYSNFYMTLNARELALVIAALTTGRGRAFEELLGLGEQLAAQFEAIYPGMLGKGPRNELTPPLDAVVAEPFPQAPTVELIGQPADAPALLAEAMAFTGRYAATDIGALTRDARARELEVLNYTFKLGGVSLACVTHFARHRIASPLFPPVLNALSGGGYVLPASVKEAQDDVRTRYEHAFVDNAKNARALKAGGLTSAQLSYCALSGGTVDMMLTMNARTLNHFIQLRTCERAQWEIRALASDMLRVLRSAYPALFDHYGPSCAMRGGRCPEGRLSCGRPRTSPVGQAD